MNTQDTLPKRPYFRPTTAAQRRLLFETYEATGKVQLACARAHVGRRTFYHWLPRFREGGYPALEQTLSHAPHKPRVPPIAPEIAQQVCDYKRQHPSAGYQTITHAVRQAHDYQPVIGPTKVRRLLLETGLVPARSRPGRKRAPEGAVHAPTPEETLNIDLCVVPIVHNAEEPFLSVSCAAAAQGAFPPAGAAAARGEELARTGL